MSNEITAIIYARVSSANQKEKDLPIESQIEKCVKKAESLGATVVKVFKDEGISGRTDDRPAFKDAVVYCQAFNVNYFICWNTSRFARNKIDAPLYKRELEKFGTRVVYVSVELDNRTNEGWILESIFELFDELQSRQTSTDTLRSMMKNAKDGFFNGGVAPLGYTVVPAGKRKKLVINEAESFIVKMIFRHYLRGIGTKAIAMQMNADGMLNRGKNWNSASVSYVLKNQVYTGKIVFNRVKHSTRMKRPEDEWIVTQSHDPIIEESEFMQVQSIFKSRAPEENTGSPHSNFVFTGLLKCGSCGSSLQIESATGRSKTYHYYNCRKWLRGGGCKSRRIPAHDFDSWMIEVILARLLTKETLERTINDIQSVASNWVKERESKREVISSSLRDTEKRLKNLYSILELHGQDAPNLSDLTLRIRELKSQRDDFEQKLINLEQEQLPIYQAGANDLGIMVEFLRDALLINRDPKKVRILMTAFIEKIVINQSSADVHYSGEALMNHASNMVHSENIWLLDLGSNQGHTD